MHRNNLMKAQESGLDVGVFEMTCFIADSYSWRVLQSLDAPDILR